jgi:hypothetical protein
MTDTPDIGIQKSIVLKKDLPLLDSDRKYFLRYRIKSKNGIATTAWSSIYRIVKPSIADLFNPTTGLYNADEREIKSHGKSFDVSWKIKNQDDLVEIPEQIKDLPLDAYVRWGGRITGYTSSGDTRTVTVNYDHHFYVGQTITAEGATEDQQTNYTVSEIVSARVFKVVSSTDTNLAIGNRLWSLWEYISTITGNSFSVPIPEHHQSTATEIRYAEFMVHLATVAKDRQETLSDTLIFYTESVSTRANYDGGSLF